MGDNDINLLKDIEQSKKAEEDFRKRQSKEKEFEKASQGAYFTLFNTVTGAATAVISVIVVEFFLWKSSRWLFWIVTSLLIISMLFRTISKHYFIKGQQKKFETFNKLSKVTGVVSSVADSTVLKGSKAVASTDKAESAQDKVTGAIATITDMQFNGGVYIDPKYDSMRERCLKMGHYISEQPNSFIQKLITDVYNDIGEKSTTKNAITITRIFSLYIKDCLTEKYPEPDEDLFYSILGALHYYKHPINEVSNNIPIVGLRDNLTSIFCVYAGYKEIIEKYSDWKIEEMRKQAVNQYSSNADSVWNILLEYGLQFSSHIFPTLDKFEKVIKDASLNEDLTSVAKTIRLLLYYWFHELFYDSDTSTITGLVGLVSYVTKDKKSKSPSLSDSDGYMDLDVILSCCEKKCSETLNLFNNWYTLYRLHEESDPLYNYLHTIVEDNEEAQMEEIKRLSSMCTDKSITNVVDRARSVVCNQFNLDDSVSYIPDDMRDWAKARGITNEQAIERIYSYLPKSAKKDTDDKRKMAIEYWNKYGHVLLD